MVLETKILGNYDVTRDSMKLIILFADWTGLGQAGVYASNTISSEGDFSDATEL